MGQVKARPPVKLFLAVFSAQLPEQIRHEAEAVFGSADVEAGPFDFSAFTRYYEEEMGSSLRKSYWAFSNLIDPSAIADIKLWSNALESRWTSEGRRALNIDPGYVELGKVVLATTKDYAHRIYLQKGIYGEVVLTYRKKDETFAAVDYTFPDYKANLDFFNRARRSYLEALRSNAYHIVSWPPR